MDLSINAVQQDGMQKEGAGGGAVLCKDMQKTRW